MSFADGYPLLLCNQASLEALQTEVGRPLEMARFRPNLVLTGAQAWAEDRWQLLQIGALRFRLAKACTRCVFTTVNPELGSRDADGEPLATLKRTRQRDDGVIFGVNLVPVDPISSVEAVLGTLEVGAAIEQLE